MPLYFSSGFKDESENWPYLYLCHEKHSSKNEDFQRFKQKKTVCIWMEWPRSVQITRSLPPRHECSHSSLNWKALLSALTHHSHHLERKNCRCKSCWKSWNSQSDLFLLLLRYWLIVWRAQTNDSLHCAPLSKCFPLPVWWEWRKTAWWLLNKKQDHLWVTDYMSDKPRREIV